MQIRLATGGCTVLRYCPNGLFQHQGHIYIRPERGGKTKGNHILVIHAATGREEYLLAVATVRPLEVRE